MGGSSLRKTRLVSVQNGIPGRLDWGVCGVRTLLWLFLQLHSNSSPIFIFLVHLHRSNLELEANEDSPGLVTFRMTVSLLFLYHNGRV